MQCHGLFSLPVIIGSLTTLFVSVIIQIVLQWYYLSELIVARKATKMDMYKFLLNHDIPKFTDILDTALAICGNMVADGLMVRLHNIIYIRHFIYFHIDLALLSCL